MQLLKMLSAVASLLLATPSLVYGAMTGEDVAAKSRAELLYNMLRFEEAFPLLESPARAGDVKSQYWMGKIQATKDKHVSEPALYWFVRAANQGDITSMIVLSRLDRQYWKFVNYYNPDIKDPVEWRNKALQISQAKANLGEGEAMYDMYILTDDLDWLVKSARAGFAEGQFRLGVEYRHGASFFLTPGRREEASKKWIHAAAEHDYVPAIKDILDRQNIEGDLSDYLHWTRRAIKAGDVQSIKNYIQWLSDPPSFLAKPADLITAYGYTLILDEAESPAVKAGSYRGYPRAEELAAKMTSEQIFAGKQFAEDWNRSHSPLIKYSEW